MYGLQDWACKVTKCLIEFRFLATGLWSSLTLVAGNHVDFLVIMFKSVMSNLFLFFFALSCLEQEKGLYTFP